VTEQISPRAKNVIGSRLNHFVKGNHRHGQEDGSMIVSARGSAPRGRSSFVIWAEAQQRQRLWQASSNLGGEFASAIHLQSSYGKGQTRQQGFRNALPLRESSAVMASSNPAGESPAESVRSTRDACGCSLVRFHPNPQDCSNRSNLGLANGHMAAFAIFPPDWPQRAGGRFREATPRRCHRPECVPTRRWRQRTSRGRAAIRARP